MFTKTNTPKPAAPAATRKPVPKAISTAPSILGSDITIIGDISSDGEIQIDGRHEGNISAAKLTIGEQGAVIGTVKATTVHVRGKVNGKINANIVELAATANVQADITQDQLTISNGAFFDGKCSRLSKTPSAAPAKPLSTQTKKTA